MIRITTDVAGPFPLISLLLEVGCMRGFVLAIELAFTTSFVLVLELVGFEVFLLYQIDGFVAWKTKKFYREHELKPRSNRGRSKI